MEFQKVVEETGNILEKTEKNLKRKFPRNIKIRKATEKEVSLTR